MKRNDGLFRLIKSLSKSEKRFFKIYSSRHVIGDQNKYIQLFNAIDKQKSYNEEGIIKKFAREKFVKRLSVAKAYLYELILRSMNVYHAQQTVEAQLRELIGNIQFLQGKRINDQALRLVSKAKKLAIEHEKLSFLPELMRLQKHILENQFYAGYKERVLWNLHQEEQELLVQLQNINDYWLLHGRLYYQQTHSGVTGQAKDLEQFADIAKHELLQDEQKALSFSARLLLYKTYSTYYFVTRNFAKCYHYSNELIHLLESRPEVLQQDSLLYVSSVNNLLNMTGMLQKTTERTYYLDKLHQMMQERKYKKNRQLQLKLFQAYYYHQMIHHIGQHRYQDALPLMDELTQSLEEYADLLDVMGEVMLCFYSFHICFCTRQFEAAYQWLCRILAHDAAAIRQDISRYAHILQLLAVYELKQPELLRATIRSTYRFLSQLSNLSPFEQLVVKLLRQLPQLENEQAFIDLLTELRQALLHLYAEAGGAQAQRYFDFLSWVHSKVVKKPFIRVMTEGDIVPTTPNNH